MLENKGKILIKSALSPVRDRQNKIYLQQKKQLKLTAKVVFILVIENVN